MKDYRYPDDLDKEIAAFFEFSAEQGEAYDRITVSAGDSSYTGIRREMINEVMHKTWGQSPSFNLMSDWQKQVLFTFVESTGLDIYRAWVLSDKKRTARASNQAGSILDDWRYKTIFEDQ